MDVDDQVAARRLHARRVAEALGSGRVHPDRRVPDPPLRGLVTGLAVAVLVVVLVGVVAVIVAGLGA